MVLLPSGNKVICKDNTIVMMKLKSAKGKKFLLACLLAVFIVAASVVTRATIGGVIEQYRIPLSSGPSSYAIQSAMIFVYGLVFTILLAIPLGIYFLGGDE